MTNFLILYRFCLFKKKAVLQNVNIIKQNAHQPFTLFYKHNEKYQSFTVHKQYVVSYTAFWLVFKMHANYCNV